MAGTGAGGWGVFHVVTIQPGKLVPCMCCGTCYTSVRHVRHVQSEARALLQHALPSAAGDVNTGAACALFVMCLQGVEHQHTQCAPGAGAAAGSAQEPQPTADPGGARWVGCLRVPCTSTTKLCTKSGLSLLLYWMLLFSYSVSV
jgi:hypothetical protein